MNTPGRGDEPADFGTDGPRPFDDGPPPLGPPSLGDPLKSTSATSGGKSSGGPVGKTPKKRRRKGWSPAVIVGAALAAGVIIVGAVVIAATLRGDGSELVASTNNSAPEASPATVNAPQQPAATTVAPAPTTPAAPATTTAAPTTATTTASLPDVPAPVSESEVQRIAEQARESVVGVHVFSAEFVRTGSGAMSTSSGFIVSSDGNIVTNAHMFEAGGRVLVSVGAKVGLRATVIGVDFARDLSVIDINGSDHKLLSLGQDTELVSGQPVVAIGFASGVSLTATSGVLSSSDQAAPLGGSCSVRLVQTNAAIKEGSFGGPLLNTNGEVIGIIASEAVGAELGGTGFAVDAKTATSAIRALQGGDPLPDSGVGQEC